MDDEYEVVIEAMRQENIALKREVDYVKQLKTLIPRLVEARADREKLAAVRKCIVLDKELRQVKRELKGMKQ